MTVGGIIDAANSFKRGTCALRGIHPRHFALLDPSAISSLISILHLSEALGCLPPQLSAVIIALLPKPTGGERPVGWYQSLYRVWIKARSGMVKEWERSHTHDYGFAAQKGKSPVDIVWRHSCLAEIAKNQDSFFLAVLWDLWKCYDSINHYKLIQAAHKHGYPVAILRIALLSYRAPRRMLYNGVVSREIWPTASIVAGNATATAELRLLLLDVAIAMDYHHKNVTLNIFIDDIILDTMSHDKHVVIQNMSAATEDLAHWIESECDLLIAPQKSAVISNSLPLAGLLRRCLKSLGGPPLGSVRSLGVDFWAGSLKKPPMKVRRSRQARLAMKRPRLAKLKKASPKAASLVYVCGFMPSALYDAPVYGLFGHSLLKLRREMAYFCGLGGKKRLLDVCLAFGRDKDPEIKSALAVVSRFSSEIWNAALPGCFRDSAGLSLGVLGSGIKSYIDGHNHPPTVVQGPISAFHKTIDRVGWAFRGPFWLSTRNGGSVDMRLACPRKVAKLG